MIRNSTGFKFNGTRISAFKDKDNQPIKLLNVTLNTDMYSEQISGSRTLKEIQIPGRNKPYLYGIDESPLEFDLTLAFESPIEINDARKIVRWLLTPRTYKELIFDDDINKVYYVVFVGEPTYVYVGIQNTEIYRGQISHINGEATLISINNIVGEPSVYKNINGELVLLDKDVFYTYDEYTQNLIIKDIAESGEYEVVYEIKNPKTIGYLTVHARCNAPTAFTPAQSVTNTIDGGGTSPNRKPIINNIGDEYCYPDIVLYIPEQLPQNIAGIEIVNTTNNTRYGFTPSIDEMQAILPNETITLDSELKIIASDKQNISPIYPRWNREYLILESGINQLEINLYDRNGEIIEPIEDQYSNTGISYKITYTAPRYL